MSGTSSDPHWLSHKIAPSLPLCSRPLTATQLGLDPPLFPNADSDHLFGNIGVGALLAAPSLGQGKPCPYDPSREGPLIMH
jgi:hypothetical protein